MLLQQGNIADVDYAIWQMTESLSELESMVPHVRIEEYDRMCEKRRREVLTVRLLLKEMLGQVTLVHDIVGRPMLMNDGRKISVSHTEGFVTIAVCKSGICGVDIEHPSHRAFKVRDRFLDANELNVVNGETDEGCTLGWCAKEATYKMLPTDTDMLMGVAIESINYDTICTIDRSTKERFTLHYVQNEHYTLVIGKK